MHFLEIHCICVTFKKRLSAANLVFNTLLNHCTDINTVLYVINMMTYSCILHELLPPPTPASQNYYLRTRAHNRQLVSRSRHLTDSNFFNRMLYTTYTSQAFLLELWFVYFVLNEYQSIN
jgi:hypothetical protein